MDKNLLKIKFLEEENFILKNKIEACAKWMKKEVEAQIHKIAKRKALKIFESSKDDFFRENQEQIIASRIQNYFGDILLLNVPKSTLEHLIYSEINYYSLQKSPNLDGFNVVSSYNKILDLFIEHFITLNYRKFVLKKGMAILKTNDPLEKALHLVVIKKYILSIGRLYGLIKNIRTNQQLYEYSELFSLYINKYVELKNLLLDDDFYRLFTEIINTDVFGSKRHSGKINFEETKRVRQIITGDFENKKSILYMFLESQSILY